MNKYTIAQKIAQVEIDAMEYQINTLVTLARKTDFNPAIMDRIITLEDELANLHEAYHKRKNVSRHLDIKMGPVPLPKRDRP